MPNLHSHAFQRAMAGLTAYRVNPADSFWSWRELMYRFAARITPDTLGAIARWLYVEMLKAGYTSVCEFHYVHHAPDGKRYANPAELAQRVVDAGSETCIGITMLPVLYQYSGKHGALRYGVAPHSLRALLEGLDAMSPGAPVHIHVAEQTAEVDASLAALGARPVQWLLDHFDVNARWCPVHATHVDAKETDALARSGATAGLCLTTEANLGDGIFPAMDYLDAHGAFGIGSDSHIGVDWRAELRLLEYGQRLLRRQRNVLASSRTSHVVDRLFQGALEDGARDGPRGRCARGRRARRLHRARRRASGSRGTDECDVALVRRFLRTWRNAHAGCGCRRRARRP